MTSTIINTGTTPAPVSYDGPGISPARIYQMYVERRNKTAKARQTASMIRQVYNGEWTTVLPELEQQERSQVANLIHEGIEAHAQRIASVMPNIMFPPENNSRAARLRASDRRQVIEAWHVKNRMNLKFRRRARYLIAYGSSPVYIRPGTEKYPIWELWDPINTYPAPGPQEDFLPHDVVYAFKRSWRWLNDTYQMSARLPLTNSQTPDTMIEVLMYCDADVMVMVAIGTDGDGAPITCQLQRVPNVTGRPCVIVPGRITLDRMAGQFDQMVGMYEAQGYLWAMHLQALKRTIFTETWLQGRPGESPQVINAADPVQGDIGVVEGGVLQAFRADPSVQTLQAIDRIERSSRLEGAIPAELGGESGSNIRTARRGTQVLSGAIDYPIQEHQDILAYSLQEEDYAAIAVSKTYWPNTAQTLLVPFGDGQVTYTPATTFDIDTHNVAYAYSGTDTNGLVIEGLQRIGAGAMSIQTFMENDPMITDPIFEHQRIIAEGIEKAHLSAIQQQAADPQGPYQPADLAELSRLVIETKKPLYEAEAILQKKIQERQNAAQQGQLSDVQMQPGNAVAGAPGTPQSGVPGQAITGPAPSQEGLASLMQALRGGQRAAPQNPPPGAA